MEELLRGSGLLEAWQTELQELLANLSSTARQSAAASGATSRRRKLFFQLQNCIDVCQETDRVSFMALPSNVILNIPIVASVVAEAPLTAEHNQFDIEVLSLCPSLSDASVVIGLTQKGFRPGHEPGSLEKSVGYKPSTGSVYKDGVEVYNTSSSGAAGVRESSSPDSATGASATGADGAASCRCVVGDKLSCAVQLNDDKQFTVTFTNNDHKVYETVLDGEVEWFPVISLKALKEEVRLLQQSSWRSIKSLNEAHGGMKLCPETGHVSYRSTRSDDRHRDALMLSQQSFSRHFSFFEIEIIAMNDKDEVAIGAVPEDYPRRLPGFRPRSVGFHASAGGIYGGRAVKADDAPVCVVGDKMGCGVEHRPNGKRIVYFTHNSKSFMEAELNDNCPAYLYPAIGLRGYRTGTVSVCIMDPDNWNSPDDHDHNNKHTQIDMTSEVSEELGEVIVDKETARASFTAPVDVAKDAIIAAKETLTPERPSFEIEILYGSLITVGLVPNTTTHHHDTTTTTTPTTTTTTADDGGEGESAVASVVQQQLIRRHPGFTADSIGYNAETGYVYVGGESVEHVGKSTYGERVGFTATFCHPTAATSAATATTTTTTRVQLVKNSRTIYEHELNVDLAETALRPVVGMRSAGQVLAVRLLDRQMWDCHTTPQTHLQLVDGEGESALMQLVDRELIECPICRDVLTDPRILPCSIHTFCAACLNAYLAQQSSRRTSSCPVCRTTFQLPPGGVSDLPVNSIVTRLLDIRSKLAAAKGQAGQGLGDSEEDGQGQTEGHGLQPAAATADN